MREERREPILEKALSRTCGVPNAERRGVEPAPCISLPLQKARCPFVLPSLGVPLPLYSSPSGGTSKYRQGIAQMCRASRYLVGRESVEHRLRHGHSHDSLSSSRDETLTLRARASRAMNTMTTTDPSFAVHILDLVGQERVTLLYVVVNARTRTHVRRSHSRSTPRAHTNCRVQRDTFTSWRDTRLRTALLASAHHGATNHPCIRPTDRGEGRQQLSERALSSPRS